MWVIEVELFLIEVGLGIHMRQGSLLGFIQIRMSIPWLTFLVRVSGLWSSRMAFCLTVLSSKIPFSLLPLQLDLWNAFAFWSRWMTPSLIGPWSSCWH